MEIRIAKSTDEVRTCFAVIRQLRPHLTVDTLAARVERQWSDGYEFAYALIDDVTRAVGGYRVIDNLAWGRFLYVDDLVTDETCRSPGLGKEL